MFVQQSRMDAKEAYQIARFELPVLKEL